MNLLPTVGAHSVHLILADLPYNLTNNSWDASIPLEALWPQYMRVLTDHGVVLLTASQPFTSTLVLSNRSWFRHEWIWRKNRGSNFANTVREPMKEHESVLVFSPGKWTYNKQMQERAAGGAARIAYGVSHLSHSENYRNFEGRAKHILPTLRVPSSVQAFNTEVGLHPTQKPVSLFRYLIRTYTNPSDLVLDNCMGSGTTGVACVKEDRDFIGMEQDPTYFAQAQARIKGTT